MTTGVARIVKQLVYGPEPIGAADAVALAQGQVRELSGLSGGGTPHFGESGTPACSWAGWTASPQQFIGNAQMGKAATAIVETYPALPNATAPVGVASWIAQQESLDNSGLL